MKYVLGFVASSLAGTAMGLVSKNPIVGSLVATAVLATFLVIFELSKEFSIALAKR